MKCHLFFLLLVLTYTCSLAADVNTATTEEKKPSSTQEQVQKNTYDLLEESLHFVNNAHDLLSEQVISISDNIDSFIGSERASDEINGSHLRIGFGNTLYEDGSIEPTLNTGIKLDLPRTNKRLSLVIESNTDNIEGTERESEAAPASRAIDEQNRQNPAINAAVQLVFQDNTRWHIRSRVGIQLHGIGLNPNTKLRIRRLFVFAPWEFRITQTLFWYLIDGVGETTQFDLERPLVPHFFFRATNKSTWFRDTSTVSFSQTLTVYHDIGRKRLLSYQVAAYADTNPNFRTTAYTASINYRQLIYLDWLYIQVTPIAIFPEKNNFSFSPAVTVTFEAIIGKTKK